MGAMSRNKGAAFERYCRERLTAWWGCPWTRTTTHHGQVKGDLPGDLVPVNPSVQFPFVVECKNDEQWSFDTFLKTSSAGGGALGASLTQAREQGLASLCGPRPYLLLLHRNRSPVFALFPSGLLLGPGAPALVGLFAWGPRWVAVTTLEVLQGTAPGVVAGQVAERWRPDLV